MTTYLLKFGDYEFPLTMLPASEGVNFDTAAQQRPRASGAVTQTPRRTGTILPVRGQLKGTSLDDLATKHDALERAVKGKTGNLFFGRSDRYYRNARCVSFSTDYNGGRFFGLLATYSIQFEVMDDPEPFVVSSLLTPALGTTGGTITVAGDATTAPVWTITLAAGGSGPFTLTNVTTGESALLTIRPNVTGRAVSPPPFGAGDVIVLDKDAYSVKLNGTARFDLLNGRIPSLAPGANVITLAAGGTATIASLGVSYAPRGL